MPRNFQIFIIVILLGALISAGVWFYFHEKQKSEFLDFSDYYQEQYKLCADFNSAKCCLDYIKNLSLRGFRLPEKINGQDGCPLGFSEKFDIPLLVCDKNSNLGLSPFWCSPN